MPTGFTACRTQTIYLEDLAPLCPAEVMAFIKSLPKNAKGQADIDTFCRLSSEDAIELRCSAVADAWMKLQDAFEKATTIERIVRTKTGADHVEKECLRLIAGYHDPKLGDCYDDIQGGYFEVDGCFQLTAAGQKFNNIIRTSAWVHQG